MLSYNELLQEKTSLMNKRSLSVDECELKKSNKLGYDKELSEIKISMDAAIEKASREELKELISKDTFKYENVLAKLGNARDEMIQNRDKRLSAITYEVYSSKVKDNMSINECSQKCENLRQILREKQGNRLTDIASKVLVSDNNSISSLVEIKMSFDDIDEKLSRIHKGFNVFSVIEDVVFGFDVDVEDKTKLISFIILCLIVLVLIYFMSPFIVLVMLLLICYYLYNSYFFCNCLASINSISENVDTISKYIEEGINSRMSSDKVSIENKFKVKINELDSKIDRVEDKIIEVTESTTNCFRFDSHRLIESFKIKENSLKEKIELLNQEYLNHSDSISKIDLSIKEIDDKIIMLSKSIYSEYYPEDIDVDKKSLLYPKDVLLDIVDNKPNIFTLPTGSTCFIYKFEDDVFDYLKLYLSYIYNNLLCSSFSISYIDEKYVGTKHIQFSILDNFSNINNKTMFDECINVARVEMDKRLSMLPNRTILDYNEEMIKEESVPLSYKIFIDLFTNESRINDKLMQILINGYKLGLVYSSFISEESALANKGSFIKKILPLYDNFYTVSSSGMVKKSKKFFEKMLEE